MLKMVAILAVLGACGVLFLALLNDDRKMAVYAASSDSAIASIEEWEHGFKTKRVIATRYKNEHMGYNIGFRFDDPMNEDRVEVSEFFEANGGSVFQSGGYPGAEAFVVFKEVTDKESANRKLRDILPKLDRLMADLAAGKKIARPKPKYEWPDAPPPEPGMISESLNINGTPYLRKEVEPGHWQYVVDEGAVKWQRQREARRQELWTALRTRVVTDEEMREILNYGDMINTPENVPFFQPEKDRERNDAFVTQLRLRTAAKGY